MGWIVSLHKCGKISTGLACMKTSKAGLLPESCQKAKTGVGRGWIDIKHERIAKPGVRTAMDLAVMPVTAEGYKYLVVYQDYYSKFIELLPLMVKTPQAMARLLVMEIFTRSGICADLHSDQGKEFNRWLIHELYHIWGINKTRTCSFTPWSNGMVGQSNRTIKGILHQMV